MTREAMTRRVLEVETYAHKKGILGIWTVYDRPTDFPEGHIARMHAIGPDGVAASTYTIKGSLHDIRAALTRAGKMRLPRDAGDDPKIVESWV